MRTWTGAPGFNLHRWERSRGPQRGISGLAKNRFQNEINVRNNSCFDQKPKLYQTLVVFSHWDVEGGHAGPYPYSLAFFKLEYILGRRGELNL